MVSPISESPSSSQTRTALATTLGLLGILAEELVRTRAVDVDRLSARIDQFALSASVASDVAPGEAEYVRQLVEMVQRSIDAGFKERDNG